MAKFQSCGENAFTYLFFSAVRRGQLVQTLLLPSLRQFGTGKRFDDDKLFGRFLQEVRNEEADIWLFPSFGRKYGFGEPDALVLLGQHSFWFEVETGIDLQSARPAFKKSLLQLARFHFFHEALKRGGKTRQGGAAHLAILGLTISNNGTVRTGVLKIRGHPVLQRIRNCLEQSKPHYVLFCHDQPQGHGRNQRFAASLGKTLAETCKEQGDAFQEWAASTGSKDISLPSALDQQNVWYTYWRGPLEREFPPDALQGYVGIRR